MVTEIQLRRVGAGIAGVGLVAWYGNVVAGERLDPGETAG